MNARISHALAALLAASAAAIANSQTPPGASMSAAPGAAVQLPANLVVEPAASVSRDDPVANAIAQALNADTQMKGAKFTVQPGEDGNILITGATSSEMQRVRATQIARAHSNGSLVVNAALPAEVVIRPAPTGLAALAESQAQADGSPVGEAGAQTQPQPQQAQGQPAQEQQARATPAAPANPT